MRRAMEDRWYFTREQLNNTPSVRCGYSADRELSCRQQAANFIQDMGQRLQVTQLCINTAIVYMHRFYMFHSFTQFHRTAISAAALFLAAKVEEQPRKLEHVIKVAYMCLHREQSQPLDTKSEQYLELAQDLVVNENVLLQTLGFDVAIDHPHTHVVQCCSLVKASKDLAQTSYFMASNSLHLTTMCLQYKPTLVACFCIHLAIKWSNWQIPESSEGRPWFWYVDPTVTQEALEQLTSEFLVIFDKCPSRLKRKIMTMSGSMDGDKKQKHDGMQSGSGMGQRPHGHGSMDESKKNMDPMTLAPKTSHPFKKLIPPTHGHQHSHGHHREQKTHGHMQPGTSSAPPKKNPNRPPAPDCMFPPPNRISEHNRQMKTEQQMQHYKQRMGGHSSMQGDMKQPPPQLQSSFIPNLHHPPPPQTNVSHSQKKQYEVPLPQQTLPPLPPLPATPPPPPPPPTLPRHQDTTISSSNYNNISVKQEITEQQSHRYDSSSNVSSNAIKQEPNHSMYIKQESMLSNRLSAEQNHNRFINDSISNTNTNSNSNSSIYNANVKQEQISTSSSSEQNHHQQHHSSHHHSSHHHSSHHRNFNDNVNYNSSNSNNYNNGGVSGANSQVTVKQEPGLSQLIEQQNHHSRYDNSNDFIKKEPGIEQNNHYQQAQQQQQQLNDNRNSITENNINVKKEPQMSSSSYSNTLSSSYENSRLSSSKQHIQHSSKMSSSGSSNVSTNRTMKAPSIFSPEKDPSPVTQNVNVGSQHAIQQQPNASNASSKLKRKRLSSSGSENEVVMVPLVKKLQQDEIARYEDPNRSHNALRIPSDKNNLSQPVVTNSASDGNWNLAAASVHNDAIQQDVIIKPSSSTNHSIENVEELGATIEIKEDNFKEDRKHKEGREHKKKKKHKEHKEHKDRERHKHKEKHKSKDKHKESSSSVKSTDAVSIHVESVNNAVSKLINSPASNSTSIERSSLKIKIPKEKLVKAMPGLKVKFRKELLQGIGKNNQDNSSAQSGGSTHHRNVVKVSSSTTRHHDSSR